LDLDDDHAGLGEVEFIILVLFDDRLRLAVGTKFRGANALELSPGHLSHHARHLSHHHAGHLPHHHAWLSHHHPRLSQQHAGQAADLPHHHAGHLAHHAGHAAELTHHSRTHHALHRGHTTLELHAGALSLGAGNVFLTVVSFAGRAR